MSIIVLILGLAASLAFGGLAAWLFVRIAADAARAGHLTYSTIAGMLCAAGLVFLACLMAAWTQHLAGGA